MSKRFIAVVALVIATLVILLFFSKLRHEEPHVSGVIEANEIRLGSRVGGRVERVLVEEGQVVNAGDPLVQLEPFDLQQKRAEAAAQLASRNADLARLKNGLRVEDIAQAKARSARLAAKLKQLKEGPRPAEKESARARVRLAEAQLMRATEDFNRDTRISKLQAGAVTQETLDRRVEEVKVAQANKDVRDQELRLLDEGTRKEEIEQAQEEYEEAAQAFRLAENGYRQEDIDQAAAAADAARAVLASFDVQLRELQIVAPVSGTIEAVELQPGDLVAAGAPVLSMLDQRRPWVRAYVPENRLDLAPSQQVRVSIDSFPNEDFIGTVTFVARQGEFVPSNAQTPEERSKQVVRIKVTLDDPQQRLRPGMSADVWLKKIAGKKQPSDTKKPENNSPTSQP